ncbi:hypothetical protein C361_01467 [Cryptococcus neoformans Tu259-1]|uniref:Uncharacterized protein n=1 Tax=Cryptococcus neoformans Tu259-1 TaxID=1230072 RepID=A0A854QJH9_CRYNE|nr:hypothetical protein C368_02299 [Cryptococcus neoformans var. grubii 125.91]OXG26110.1 hypothetical protein C361_01467 [Cryptococcus neoformans var. grubii Tu259-1]
MGKHNSATPSLRLIKSSTGKKATSSPAFEMGLCVSRRHQPVIVAGGGPVVVRPMGMGMGMGRPGFGMAPPVVVVNQAPRRHHGGYGPGYGGPGYGGPGGRPGGGGGYGRPGGRSGGGRRR